MRPLFISLIALCLLAVGCDGERGTITATVVPSQALPTVLVLESGGDIVAEVRPSFTTGEVTLELESGTYDVVVTADGYLPNSSNRSVVLAAGETVDLGRIELFRGGTGSVTGSVEPAEVAASVSLLQAGALVASAPTHEGEFLLLDIPVGTYELVVTAPGFQRYEAGSPIVVAEATTLMLDPVTLEPSTTPTGSIAGSVSPADVGATVTAHAGGVPAGSAAALPDGSFRLDGLSPGTYRVEVEAPGYARVAVDGVMVSADGVTELGAIALRRPTRVVRGQVLDAETRAAVPGVRVRLGDLRDLTRADGSFQLADPPAGTHTLWLERSYYVPSASIVEVAAEGDVELELTLQPAGQIRGHVQDASGSGVRATVTAGGARASTSASGEYVLLHVPPGRHVVRAEAEGYAATSTAVEVARGVTATLDLALIRAGSVTGTITSSEGGAVAGAIVSAGGITGVTGADGSYALRAVPAGTHSATVSAPHFISATASVIVPEGGVATLDRALTPVPRVTVTGRITREDTGEPVAGATVYLGPGYALSGTTDASGTYTVPRSASYALVPSDITQLRVSVTGHPTTTQTIDLTAAGATVTIDATLASYATIHGRVVDAASGAGVPDVTAYCTGATAQTGADGSFVATNVTPGDVSCWVNAPCYAYAPVAVTGVRSGEVRGVVLLVERKADLVIHTRNADTLSSLPGVTVSSGALHATSDAAGVATFECVAAMTYTLVGWRSGYSSAAARVLVPATGVVDAWLDLAPAD